MPKKRVLAEILESRIYGVGDRQTMRKFLVEGRPVEEREFKQAVKEPYPKTMNSCVSPSAQIIDASGRKGVMESRAVLHIQHLS